MILGHNFRRAEILINLYQVKRCSTRVLLINNTPYNKFFYHTTAMHPVNPTSSVQRPCRERMSGYPTQESILPRIWKGARQSRRHLKKHAGWLPCTSTIDRLRELENSSATISGRGRQLRAESLRCLNRGISLIRRSSVLCEAEKIHMRKLCAIRRATTYSGTIKMKPRDIGEVLNDLFEL